MWPRWIDPSAPAAKPYKGWPVTLEQLDNGLFGADWELEKIETGEFGDPVIQVRKADGEVVYTLRIVGSEFVPLVREAGVYTVIGYDPDGDYRKTWTDVEARRRTSSDQARMETGLPR